jgi:hypothetical protein
MGKGYKHKNFCRNNVCCASYCSYLEGKRIAVNSPDSSSAPVAGISSLPETPFVFKTNESSPTVEISGVNYNYSTTLSLAEFEYQAPDIASAIQTLLPNYHNF